MSALIPAWVDGVLAPVDAVTVHRRGLRHKAVSVFVMRGERTLIQRRALSKLQAPGVWANACCTHPGWGEAPEACAARRLGEELGVTGLAPAHRDRIEARAPVLGGPADHEVIDVYVAEATDALAVTPDPGEVAETIWIDIEELLDEAGRRPERFAPWVQGYLSERMDRLLGGGATGADGSTPR